MQLLLYRYLTTFVNTSQLKLRALNITEVLFKAPREIRLCRSTNAHFLYVKLWLYSYLAAILSP